MVLVTDKQFYMDPALKGKMDLCIDRCTKHKMDNLLIIDGDEGYGKSTLAVELAYYIAHQTKRPFTVDNVFFDIEKLIEFAKSTHDQIIVWDEAALGGLSTEWANKNQVELVKLLMVARKKRHFWIFNIPKFFKLNEYILVDRAIGLVHVYARKELEIGRFCYFKKKSKEQLFYDRLRTRQRFYNKHHDFHGTFPNKLKELIDEEEYEKKKDEAIMSIGKDKEKENPYKTKLLILQAKIPKLPLTQKELCLGLGVSKKSIYNWTKIPEKYPELVGI